MDAVQLLAREHKVVEFNMADARVSDLEHVKVTRHKNNHFSYSSLLFRVDLISLAWEVGLCMDLLSGSKRTLKDQMESFFLHLLGTSKQSVLIASIRCIRTLQTDSLAAVSYVYRSSSESRAGHEN